VMAPPEDQVARAARTAVTQSTFRSANMGIARKADDLDLWDVALPFVCECSDRGCSQLARLTLREYKEVRTEPNQFLVIPEHDGEVDEPTVKTTNRYVIVAKEGEAGRIAAELEWLDETA
jgi:hypothetical protein